ncbi:DUF6456 domain-containing protein [Frigidibacter sp. MR17.24]|uniref:DUF6456 domain-containing protein n=1 Tax=Frigidibacter sp. MR17.24 TaxID=3127345 RepID=UPI003012D860
MSWGEAEAGLSCLAGDLRLYLSHVEEGRSIRALARECGCHASTVLRRVRRLEARRDDPLVDEVLGALGALGTRAAGQPGPSRAIREDEGMSQHISGARPAAGAAELPPDAEAQALRILTRLAETGAFLAVAPGMERAAVLRDGVRRAVAERGLLQLLAINDWIALDRRQGRVLLYTISAPGRAALRRASTGGRLLPAAAAGAQGDVPGRSAAAAAAAGGGFAEQHREWVTRDLPSPEDGRLRAQRCNLAESPLTALARRRDRDGQPFLSQELVAAGERLREDFELAQLGPRVAQNWERFLTSSDRGGFRPGGGADNGSAAARDRVAAALRALGPGLGDMVLRCCCYLEGLEAAEQRMGWSARSGKIVLRIALMQLKRHYDDVYGNAPRMIG